MRITTKTITTNYELCGPEQAPVAMLSHSLASGMSMWDPQLTALQSRFRILRYDSRGHGGSDVPDGPYRLDDLVADAVALMDALAIRQVHFVGLSMGGMIGQGIALAHPDRLLSLSLCSTSAWIPPQAQPVVQERIDTALKEGLQALVDGTLARWFTPGYLKTKPPEVERIRRQFLATPVVGYVGCTEAIRRLDYLEQLARIKVPTLILVGEEDTLMATDNKVLQLIQGFDLTKPFSTARLHHHMGKRLWEQSPHPEKSMVAAAAKFD